MRVGKNITFGASKSGRNARVLNCSALAGRQTEATVLGEFPQDEERETSTPGLSRDEAANKRTNGNRPRRSSRLPRRPPQRLPSGTVRREAIGPSGPARRLRFVRLPQRLRVARARLLQPRALSSTGLEGPVTVGGMPTPSETRPSTLHRRLGLTSSLSSR